VRIAVSIEYRRPTHDEHLVFVRTFLDTMNARATDDEIEEGRAGLELERSWLAADGGRIVGTTSAHSYDMTVPGGASAGFGGLTLVSALPTHRRRGVMTELVSRFFADCQDRQDVFAGLFASEAAIYGRFGFGPATRFASVTIDRARAGGIESVSTPGCIRLAKVGDVVDDLTAIFERTRPRRAGEIARDEHYWTGFRRRIERTTDERPIWVAIHEGAGGADGYAIYRIESKWIDHTAQNQVHVVELVGDGAVRLALWRFMLELDLVRTVSDGAARLDEPVHDVLADPRQLRTLGVYDQLQLRVVDVGRALAVRTYAVDGAVTIAVDDNYLAGQAGTWRVEAAGSVTNVESVRDEPDIAVSARGLAIAYLGDRSWRSLADAGLARVSSPRAAAIADAMFSVSPSPQCLTVF
jgi:predicted acetyltransferase